MACTVILNLAYCSCARAGQSKCVRVILVRASVDSASSCIVGQHATMLVRAAQGSTTASGALTVDMDARPVHPAVLHHSTIP